MQLSINKEIIEVPKNKYKVSVDFMFGDADGDATEEVLVDDNQDNKDELERFIKCLIMCNAAYPHGRGGYDNYNRVPDYDRYFSEDWDEDQPEPSIYCQHPWDPAGDGIQSSFSGFSITHFDESGIERQVEYSISRPEKEELTTKLKEAGFKYSNIR